MDKSVVRGRVWLPTDPDFDLARRAWNLAVDQPVAAVVEAADAADVAALVRYANTAGLTIATQAGGHGATGRTEGAILLRTKALDTLEIDPATRTARVGAGVASGRLQRAAAAHGLTGLPGSSPVVSVAGVALGGGLSWFGRAHGWVADSVTAFDVVDARGRQQRVTAGDDRFWALRGAGGDVAIVTGLELTLHPAPRLYGGRVLWAGEHAAAVVDVFRRITATAPDALTVWLDLLHFPGGDPMVALDATYLGDAREARELLAPLDELPRPLSDGRRVMRVDEVGAITGDPTDPSPGRSRAELLTELTDTTAKALLADPVAPLLSVQVRHLGGALARPSDSPHGPLAEPYLVYMFGAPTDAVRARQRELAEALPVSGRKPYTFLNPDETAADAFTPEVVARLLDLKRTHDPAGVFRANFGV